MTRQPVPPSAPEGSAGAVSDSATDGCVTCSDAATPVRIRALLDGQLALVETAAGLEEVSVALVAAAPGQVVLVHAKEAIAVVEAES